MAGCEQADLAELLLRAGSKECKRYGPKIEVDQTSSQGRDDVVVTLRGRRGEDLGLALGETQGSVLLGDRGDRRLAIRQQDLGPDAVENDGRERRFQHVDHPLRDEHDGSIELAELAEPVPDALREERVVEENPRFFEHDEGRAPGQPLLDAVEEVEEERDDRSLVLLHHMAHLEDVVRRIGGQQGVFRRVEELPVGPAERVGGESLAQLAREENGEVGEGAARRAGEQAQGVEQLAAQRGVEGYALERQQLLQPVGGPIPLVALVEELQGIESRGGADARRRDVVVPSAGRIGKGEG